jgi:hypothetical protein
MSFAYRRPARIHSPGFYMAGLSMTKELPLRDPKDLSEKEIHQVASFLFRMKFSQESDREARTLIAAHKQFTEYDIFEILELLVDLVFLKIREVPILYGPIKIREYYEITYQGWEWYGTLKRDKILKRFGIPDE